MRQRIRDALASFNDPLQDYRIRLFYVLAIGGIVISIFTFIVSVLTDMWATAVICVLLVVVSSALIWFITKTGRKQTAYLITVILIFMMLFPVMFFTSGGHRSGTPSMFMFAVIFTVLMLKGRTALVFSVLELIEYSAICVIAYYVADYLPSYDSEFEILCDIIIFFSSTSIICGLALYFHLKEYDKQRALLHEQNERLKRYDASRSSFLTTVSHEIKNPLNAINLYAIDTTELLSEEPVDFALIRDNQQTIVSMVGRVDAILVDLKDTVAIEQGRLALRLAPMKTQNLIHETMDKFYKLRHVNDNSFELALDETLPPVMADYARIVQVLTNLIENAMRHTQQGKIVISLSRQGNQQLICVSDNGEGMSDELKKKVLKGYVSTSEDYWRHGIGLYVCHQIVVAHDGALWIDSALGEGTSVYFTLPYMENTDE